MKRDLAWLRELSRPTRILFAEEMREGREEEFLRCFEQQLERFAPGRNPLVAEVFAARRAADAIWKFDRLTGDREAQQEAKKWSTRSQQRAEHFAEAEERARLTELLRQDIEDVERFLALAAPRTDVEGEQPIPADNVARLA